MKNLWCYDNSWCEALIAFAVTITSLYKATHYTPASSFSSSPCSKLDIFITNIHLKTMQGRHSDWSKAFWCIIYIFKSVIIILDFEIIGKFRCQFLRSPYCHCAFVLLQLSDVFYLTGTVNTCQAPRVLSSKNPLISIIGAEKLGTNTSCVCQCSLGSTWEFFFVGEYLLHLWCLAEDALNKC